MPANLTAQYHKAEEEYRRASSPEEELQCLQTMLRELPKHKGTDKLHADLKQKISRLKKDLESGPKTGKKGPGVRIPRQGAGRVVLVGAPNTGKSQLLASLTRAAPEVAPYPFTTREPIPGMMPWQDVLVQLIDTPPVTAEVMDPHLQGLVRGADLVLLLVDLATEDGIDQYYEVLERFHGTKTRLGATSYLDPDDLGLTYTRTFLLLNKIDSPDADAMRELFAEEVPDPPFCAFPISAARGDGLDELKEAIYSALDVVRVYTKSPQEKEPDYERPYTVKRGSTLLDVAEQIHKDLAENLKSARVWGSAVHDGTPVKPDYVLQDRDVVELHT